MLQILLIAASIGFIVVGIKGFSKTGLPVSKTTNLTGPSAKIIGVICILVGIALIPIAIFGISLMVGP